MPISFASFRPAPRGARLLLCATAAVAGLAQAADVSVQPAAGDAFVVSNSAGSSELLRIEEDGSQIAVGAAANKLLVDADGRVLAGAAFNPTPANRYRFQIDGVTGSLRDNGLRINNTTAGSGWSLYSSSSGELIIGKGGNLGEFDGITGAYTSLSDERAKSDIRPLEGVLGKVMQLPLSRYRYKGAPASAGSTMGVSAQALQKQFPELVSVNTTDEGNPIAPQQMFVNYAGMGVVALRALQEQQQLIEALQAEVAALKSRLGAAR